MPKPLPPVIHRETQTRDQEILLKELRRHLSGENASPEIQRLLADPTLRRWLDTWVRPLVEAMLDAYEPAPPGKRKRADER